MLKYIFSTLVGLAAGVGSVAVYPSPQSAPTVNDRLTTLEADVQSIKAALVRIESEIGDGPAPPPVTPPAPVTPPPPVVVTPPPPDPTPTPTPAPPSDLTAAFAAAINDEDDGFRRMFDAGENYSTSYVEIAAAAKAARVSLNKLLIAKSVPLLNSDGTWKTDPASVAARKSLYAAWKAARYQNAPQPAQHRP